MKIIVIKSSEWARGPGKDRALLQGDGLRCCLGIDGRACGISDDLLLGAGTPSDLGNEWGYEWESWDHDLYDSLEHAAADINDDENLTDEERIAELRPIFRKAGRVIRWLPNA